MKTVAASLLATSFLIVACSEVPTAPVAPPSRALDVAGQRVLRVPDDFGTIQAAVNAAAPGDVIDVKPGVYRENVTIRTSELRLRGWEGAVLDGTGLGATGIYALGTAAQPLTGVEVVGFEVRNFVRGIVLERVSRALVRGNNSHHNVIAATGSAPALGDAVGIDLRTVLFAAVDRNTVHDNGADGIAVRVGSGGVVVAANRIYDNGAQAMNGVLAGMPDPTSDRLGHGVLVTGPSNNNQVVGNEILRTNGWGIQVARPTGVAPITGNLVAQNQVHDNARAGIALMGSASGNVIVNNDARFNNWSGLAPCLTNNLFDDEPFDNVWISNLGTSNVPQVVDLHQSLLP